MTISDLKPYDLFLFEDKLYCLVGNASPDYRLVRPMAEKQDGKWKGTPYTIGIHFRLKIEVQLPTTIS